MSPEHAPRWPRPHPATTPQTRIGERPRITLRIAAWLKVEVSAPHVKFDADWHRRKAAFWAELAQAPDADVGFQFRALAIADAARARAHALEREKGGA